MGARHSAFPHSAPPEAMLTLGDQGCDMGTGQAGANTEVWAQHSGQTSSCLPPLLPDPQLVPSLSRPGRHLTCVVMSPMAMESGCGEKIATPLLTTLLSSNPGTPAPSFVLPGLSPTLPPPRHSAHIPTQPGCWEWERAMVNDFSVNDITQGCCCLGHSLEMQQEFQHPKVMCVVAPPQPHMDINPR